LSSTTREQGEADEVAQFFLDSYANKLLQSVVENLNEVEAELHMKKWRTPMKANQNIKGLDLMDVYLEQDVNQALTQVRGRIEEGL
jgi:hypothetical protein